MQELRAARLGALCVFFGAVALSFAPLFVRIEGVGPSAVAMHRLFWGGLVLLAAAALRGERLRPAGRSLGLILLCAAFFSLDLSTWHMSIVRIGPGLSTILLCNFQMLFLALAGALLLGERLSGGLLLALPTAGAGLWLLLGADGAPPSQQRTAGILLAMVSGMFYAAYILCLKRVQSRPDRLPAVSAVALVSLLCVPLTGATAVLLDEPLAAPGLAPNLLLLLCGVCCQGGGWLLIAHGLPRVPASRTGLIMLIQPTLSFAWDVLFFGRPTGPAGYLGAALAIAAISLGGLGRRASSGE